MHSGRPWRIERGEGPIVAVALHGGHELRADLAKRAAIPERERLREEDPLTGVWAQAADSTVHVFRSRFEVDLNRPRAQAVAARAADVWGLELWLGRLPASAVEASLREHDLFYAAVDDLLKALLEKHARLLVLDLHSYNHRRAGPQAPAADPAANPEINIGTGTLHERERWAPLIETFMAALRDAPVRGEQPLDVRENVKFFGGYFPEWIHDRYPSSVCTLSIECKKFFMDEWSGMVDAAQIEALRAAIAGAAEAARPLLIGNSRG